MQESYSPDIESKQDYYERIEASADIIEGQIDEGLDVEVSELVWEEADSSRVAIYTHEALSALQYSNNDPEEWKHLVAEDATWQDVIAALAFQVYRQDLWDELDGRGIE